MYSRWCYLMIVLCDAARLLMAAEPCLGGRSLRGLTELSEHDRSSTTTVSCCDENVCHGGLALKNEDRASFIINDPFGYSELKHQYAQHVQSNHGHDAAQRHKRSTNGGRCVENKMACLPIEIRCCSANMSVFFPISAISALTGERVHVIQAPPLVLQPVVFGRCETEHSSILDAECHQDVVPEMMHVGRINSESNELELSREPVMVESGCSCRLNREPLDIIDGTDIDETMASFLDLWTD
ncbi:hypothetical protein GHT06_019130 [Daphnia sinensis]|uniref:Uncharacterized protein n=1 Tax=Daphnia sinensis TaxID=1820382 RepID=A0AAD5PSS4_9CRUS|nr:hypothetical protein GHT06_019130 [Daphnia sinensis]